MRRLLLSFIVGAGLLVAHANAKDSLATLSKSESGMLFGNADIKVSTLDSAEMHKTEGKWLYPALFIGYGAYKTYRAYRVYGAAWRLGTGGMLGFGGWRY